MKGGKEQGKGEGGRGGGGGGGGGGEEFITVYKHNTGRMDNVLSYQYLIDMTSFHDISAHIPTLAPPSWSTAMQPDKMAALIGHRSVFLYLTEQ